MVKAAFHDTDIDTCNSSSGSSRGCRPWCHGMRHQHQHPRKDSCEEIVHVEHKDVGVSGESVSVSMSMSWNMAFMKCAACVDMHDITA